WRSYAVLCRLSSSLRHTSPRGIRKTLRMFHFLGRRAVSAVFHYCIGHLPLLSRQRRLHIRLLGRCRTKGGGLLTEMVTMRLVCCPTSLRCSIRIVLAHGLCQPLLGGLV